MKKLLALIIFTAFSATAQIQLLDGTTPHTNNTTTSAQINVPSKGWTNVPYATTNYIYITYGDGLPGAATTKLNSNLIYLTNQLWLAFQLPNQINTNWQTYSVGLSNYMTTLANNMGVTNAWIIAHVATNHGSGYAFSNGWFSGDGRGLLISGTNLDNGTVNSNALDYATLTWLQSLLAPGALMLFDGFGIYSDGLGNIHANAYQGQLWDAYWSSGSIGMVPIANGDGTWNWGSGGGGGTTVDVTNAVTGAPGTSVLVTNLGSSMAAVFQFTIPRGADGTNFVTVNQFTNVVLSSQLLTAFYTNNVIWSTSNFLARVNGLYDCDYDGGSLGGVGLQPATNVFFQLVGSYSGTNSWFVITNGFRTTNAISVAATGAGGGLGFAALYTVDHPELLSRTNFFFGQYTRFDAPLDPSDAATKNYVDTLVANAFGGIFTNFTDTNGVSHLACIRNRSTIWDIASLVSYAPIASLALSGTNLLLTTPATNLTAGFVVQSSTNLALAYGFATFTNWTTNTVSGLTTFTIPLQKSEPQRFFRVQTSSSSSSSFNVPVAFNGGVLYPSNTWSLTTITNGMKPGDITTVNSNGVTLVDVWMSNSVPTLRAHW